MCLHPCFSRQFYTGNKGNSCKMCLHPCCRRQLYIGNKGNSHKMCLHPSSSRQFYTGNKGNSRKMCLAIKATAAKCTDTPMAACPSCAMIKRRSRTHISILLRALVKKLYSNAQVFKPQSAIRSQSLYRLLLQLIHCCTSIQHAVSFTRTLHRVKDTPETYPISV